MKRRSCRASAVRCSHVQAGGVPLATALLSLLVSLLLPPPALAADATFDVLFDLDRNSVTGCAVASADGVVPGIELRLRTTVDLVTEEVTAVTSADCTVPLSGTFGAESPIATVVAPPWDIVVGNGTSGSALIETALPLALLPLITTADVYTTVTSAAGSDALTAPDGAYPLSGIAVGVSGAPVPALSLLGSFALVCLLGLVAVVFVPRALHPHALVTVLLLGSLLAPAIVGAALGNGTLRIWAPEDVVAVDPVSDAPEGVDILNLSVNLDIAQDALFIRLDVFLGPAVCLEWGTVDPGVGFPCAQEPPPDMGPFGLQVAMTFDDGPSPATTPGIVAILRANNIPATFFMQGSRLTTPAEQAIALDIHQDPLFQIANHVYTHTDMTTLTAQQISDELNGASDLIRAAVGDECYFPPYMRFPYGRTDCFSMGEVRKHGFGVAGVNIDPVDWCYGDGDGFCSPTRAPWVPAEYQYDMPGYAVQRLLSSGGGIMLMHDIQANTLAELPAVITAFQNAGATFVGLDNLTLFPIINANVNPPEPPACCDGGVN